MTTNILHSCLRTVYVHLCVVHKKDKLVLVHFIFQEPIFAPLGVRMYGLEWWFSKGEGSFALWETSDNIWRHFSLSQWRGGLDANGI